MGPSLNEGDGGGKAYFLYFCQGCNNLATDWSLHVVVESHRVLNIVENVEGS